MTVAISAAASFLIPVETPANVMVMEPGGYRFGDYQAPSIGAIAVNDQRR